MGSGVGAHVKEYLDKDDAEQEAHLKSLGVGVSSSVASHLGAFETTEAKATRQNRAAKVRTLFGNQETIRQAILVNEILSPPKSLR
ncbi:MAG: hypothetical protein R3C11_12195 [Planctomycetaceae bacterium]